MGEYFNLINRVRQGVLVLHHGDPKSPRREVAFCNKAAARILTNTKLIENVTSDGFDTPIFFPFNTALDSEQGNATGEAGRSMLSIVDEDDKRDQSRVDRIFKVVHSDSLSPRTAAEKRYTTIYVESIEYQQQPATAIYFEEMTQYVNVLKMESRILEEKNKSQSLESYTSMISHEFRTPISTSMTMIEGILKNFDKARATLLLNLIFN